jgi:transcriptional regulator GlxA family with amidase domain
VSSVGATLAALDPLPADPAPNAWVVVLGQPSAALPPRQRMGAAWRRAADWLSAHFGPQAAAWHPARRIVTVCSGSLLAAHAGLIGARACTTHHDLLDELRALAPQAQVLANRVFVTDGALASSAGITAGIDLMLHLIAQTCGDAVAAAVAQTMVVVRRRGAHEPQRSALFDYREHLHPVLHRVQDAVCERPDAPWTLAAMAAVGHVTPRHLTRLFTAHAGTTPLRYVQRIRLERAAQARARGATATEAALDAGFSSQQQLRRAREAASRHAAARPDDVSRKRRAAPKVP